MIQVLPGGPCYDVGFVGGEQRGARVARSLQSATAEALLQELRAQTGIAGPSSKAHSRALAAAAVARARVGIDVEYRAPERRIEEIASYLMGTSPHDASAAYRVFTFREAYFKAFGDWPDKHLMREAANAAEPGEWACGLVRVRHESIGEDFNLTLVWSEAP
jgi:hypothetical protein